MKKNNSNIEYVEKPKSSHILRIHTVPNTIIFEPYAFYDIPTILKDALQYLKASGTERGLVVNLNNVIVPIRSDMTNREAIQVWKNEIWYDILLIINYDAWYVWFRRNDLSSNNSRFCLWFRFINVHDFRLYLNSRQIRNRW